MKLILTLRAEADIDDIAAYISARSPQAARRIEAEIQSALELIGAYPFVGRRVGPGVRRFSLSHSAYLIFYGVDEATEEVRVFTVRHAARRPED